MSVSEDEIDVWEVSDVTVEISDWEDIADDSDLTEVSVTDSVAVVSDEAISEEFRSDWIEHEATDNVNAKTRVSDKERSNNLIQTPQFQIMY